MAIKKKAILTDNTTLPTTPTVIPTLPPVPPLLTNIIALPFGLAYKLPTQNVRNIPVLPDSTATRPSQNVGFDISITRLTQPNPMYLNDINGIFNLYSGTLADICSGLVPQFDIRYIQIRQQLNLLPPPPPPTPAPTPLIAGYPAGAVLFSPTNLAWYLSLQDDNQDPSINTTTPSVGNWQKITDVSNNLVQQGRLTGIFGKPYNDTLPAGSPTLYFTPTEQGNLISLYNGNNWVTQPFSQVSLDVSLLSDTSLQAVGSLTYLNVNGGFTNPSGVTVSPDGLNVYLVNYSNLNLISSFRISGSGTNMVLYGEIGTTTGNNPIRIAISPDGNNGYVTCFSDNNIRLYSRSSSDGSLTGIVAQTEQNTGPNPQGIAISPNGLNVYITGASRGQVELYVRDTSNGHLSPLQSQPAIATGSRPNEIIISPLGDNLYVTNQFSNTVSQYYRNTDGTLNAIGTDTPVPTENYPTALVISPDGKNVYVTNFLTRLVSQYSRNISTGILSALSPATVSCGQYPNQITISPDGLNVYVTNAYVNNVGDNKISEYSRNLGTGQLTLFDSIGTQTNPIQIVTTPNGTNVFVTNYNDNSLSSYSRIVPTPPTVSLTQPNRTSNVPIGTLITLTFSEAVTGVNTNTIQFQSQGGQPQTITITQSGNSYSLTGQTLVGSTTYIVSVGTGITSVATGLSVTATQFTFRTVNTNVPTVYISSPTSNVDINNPLIQLQFSEGVTGVTPISPASATGTVRFSISGQSAQNITITRISASLYTLNVITPLLNGTEYSVDIINTATQYITGTTTGNRVVAITLNLTTRTLPVTLYDIFVGNNTSNVLTLAQDTFSGGTGTGSNRQQLPNGKWVNAHTITTTTPTIQTNQGLLVGSIAVSGGKVQSWNGYRGIFNLYNQVALELLAYQNPATLNPVPNSWKWNYNSTTVRNQNANNIAGQGNFYFLIDLLYNQAFTCEYNGGGYFTAVGDNGTVGIALNPTTTLTPLVNFTYGGLSGSAGIVPFNLSYGYQFNNVSTTQLPVGLNWLQKVESGVGYFSDNIGLTAIYYG